MSDIPVSVVLPVKNEEANLDRCLARLTRFAEVVVVDSSSTDSTPAIARSHGVRLLNFVWDGHYPKKRNWVLLNHSLKCDWVLFLDADELVNAEVCDAIEVAVRSGRYEGYWLNYINYFLGKRLRHGIPQRKLALFRVGKGLYERIDEDAWSRLDMEIHEHPIVAGSVGEIQARIDHHDDRGVMKFIDRHREYAIWEVRRFQFLHSGGGADQWKVLTKRQAFKYRNLGKSWFPFFYFTLHYFVRLGIIDGYAGLHYALLKLWYFSTIQLLCKYPPHASIRKIRPA